MEVVRRLNHSDLYLKTGNFFSKAFYFNPPLTEIVTKSFRKIEDLHSYYNFQNVKDKKGRIGFFSTIFSNLTTLKPVDSVVDRTKNVKIKNVVEIKDKSKPADQASNER